MKTQMTNVGAANLYNAVSLLLKQSTVRPAPFLYAITRTQQKLKQDVKTFMDVRTKTLEAYEEKRIKLNKENSSKDKLGKPILINNEFQISPNFLRAFEAGMKRLEKEYAKELKEAKALMDTNNDFEIHTIDIEKVPDLESGFMPMLIPMISNGKE